MYQWIVFLHVTGVFGFLLAHGGALGVALRLRHERDPWAVRALLGVSAATRGLMYGSLALLLTAGAAAGVMGDWWHEGWIWAALVLLIVITAVAIIVGTPHYRRLRAAVAAATAGGMPSNARSSKRGAAASAELDALLVSPVPLLVSVVAALGLVAILWLMLFKPL